MGAHSTAFCIFAAGFYAFVSISITFFNKALLSVYLFNFPSLLLILQHVFTIVLLEALKYFNVIQYPNFNRAKAIELLPIALLYSLNVGFALSALANLNIPMYGVLKRITTLFVLIGESVFLHKKSSSKLRESVILIVLGAFIAGAGDLTFDIGAYMTAALSCAIQAAYLLYVSKSGAEKGINTFGLLFYNSMTAIPFVLVFFLFSSERTEIMAFEGYTTFDFQFFLLTNLLLGSLLNYSMFLCTTVNSALTTTIMGNLKNLLSVFLGLLILEPPKTTYTNLVGLIVNAMGGVWYSIIKYREQASKPILPSVK